ncbi:hypothetical protein [Spongiactinospora sp. 9N601]|uniref:hypothetical protein n=1 Tax=Spongiactinospora sp. 9N601 TaxID=3375149 RepID=UPI0037A68066
MMLLKDERLVLDGLRAPASAEEPLPVRISEPGPDMVVHDADFDDLARRLIGLA